ncbi:MAG: flavin monoamine oxidase family protein [Gaiellales bacterium]
MTDVIVVGGGLAGLTAARDLMLGGADVVCLEARERPGGRVHQEHLADGRTVQMGAELVGEFHTTYLGLARELGLELRPGFMGEPGQMTWNLAEGVCVGDNPPWWTEADRAERSRVQSLLAALSRTVDPDDPWGHPDAARLDQLSVNDWLREVGAPPALLRLSEVARFGGATGSGERMSLLAVLRMDAVAGSKGTYDYDFWESMTLAAGSAALPLAMAVELGDRLRLGAVVRSIEVSRRVTVGLEDGEALTAEVVVCALPVGPLRDVQIEGLTPARLASLRRVRHALAVKAAIAYRTPFWRERGQNGVAEGEGPPGPTWPQADGVLSVIIPPERLAFYLGAPPEVRREQLLADLVRLYGPAAGDPSDLAIAEWAIDPFTKGYLTQWAPGDLTAVGALHGTHEPPFYVCGSDHWVAGWMEGAVRTGRSAAAAALGHLPAGQRLQSRE